MAASNRLAPQLTSRCEVVLFPAYPEAGQVYGYRHTFPPPTADWIIHDRQPPHAWPYRSGRWPYPRAREQAELDAAKRKCGYRVVAKRDGITLMRRNGS